MDIEQHSRRLAGPSFPELLGVTGLAIAWPRAIGFALALVTGDLVRPVFELFSHGNLTARSWLLLVLSNVVFGGVAVVALRSIRLMPAPIAAAGVGYAVVMSGVRWIASGGAFERYGQPPQLLEPVLVLSAVLYAALLLSALVLLVPRLKPVWLALGLGAWAASAIANLLFLLMLRQYMPIHFSLLSQFQNLLFACVSAAVFAGVFWAFVGSAAATLARREGTAMATAAAVPQRSMGWLLFSFTGRATRSQYWIAALCMLPLTMIGWVAILSENQTLTLLYLPFGLAAGYCGLAVAAKRLHDRDRSAWWLAAAMIPLAGIFIALWLLVEMWFLRGTVWPNRFGPDPLAPANEPDVAPDGRILPT
jgi:uncharacterized membrane protein YhaH (DUF805 family)